MSVFGGPEDQGVGVTEGLALMSADDPALPLYANLFLDEETTAQAIAKAFGVPAPRSVGMARRLNVKELYIAMRWDEGLAPFKWIYRNRDGSVNGQTYQMLRHAKIRLTNPENQFCVFATPVDYGPGDGKMVDGHPTEDTERLADLSPAAANILRLKTNDIVRCELILPEPETEAPIIASDFGSKGESGAPGVQSSGSAAPGGKEIA
jgi:hypothetical protein